MGSKVSFIVTVYNAKAYIAECLQSIIDQSHRDIEVLLMIDRPTDGTDRICEEFARKDQRIKCYHSEKNIGGVLGREKGFALAQGEYVIFVESSYTSDRLNVVTRVTDISGRVRRATELGVIDRILFCGKVQNMSQLYTESEIFVISSRSKGFPDGFGRRYPSFDRNPMFVRAIGLSSPIAFFRRGSLAGERENNTVYVFN